MNVKEEIDKAIVVIRARLDYIMYNEDHKDHSLEEYLALCKAADSLEEWREDE